jgi:hypothetical protein
MVTMMYVIFVLWVVCVCVCVMTVMCFRGGWFLGVRHASACAVRHKYFHLTICFHPSVFGISFLVLLDMQSLEKLLHDFTNSKYETYI